jgi:iron complex outermembrane receptor protein
LEETKPITLEEVLNKTPGVLMVDLGNEQHSMSIRQPISYKSVFLYLEDGLPIRTTGVFNHNALIEINHSALKKIEIIRGPYSAMYGSGAIGDAINFITKEPTATPEYNVYGMLNNVGYRKLGVSASNSFGKTGIYVAADYSGRRNGYREHSDYDKKSFFIKMNNQLSKKTYLKSAVNYIDYQTDMTGGLDSLYFYGQDYTSQYRFTYRKVKALRYYTKLVSNLSDRHQVKATVFARYNQVGQNPHYRIKDDYKPWTGTGDPNLAHGEINENKFYSVGTILEDTYKLKRLSISKGVSIDYSPNSYYAKYIKIHKTDDAIYDTYEETDSLKTNYDVNILNIGVYANAEYKVSNAFKLLASARLDNINYDFDNHLDASAFSGAPDSQNFFNAFTPKVGGVLKVNNDVSFYANYSKGFRPPEVGELYRGVKVPTLKPVYYDNYEGGTWISLFDKKLIMDLSYYVLKAENEIISVKLDDGSRINQNVAQTTHQGFEFGVQYFATKELSLKVNGAVSKHKFDVYTPKGHDYSGNEMPGAPKLIMSSELKYRPHFIKNAYAGLEWFHVDPYYMDEANTKKYEGYDTFNLRIGKQFKQFKVWLNVLNLTDVLYATSASKSAWGTSYRPGEKRSFNLGLSYTIK